MDLCLCLIVQYMYILLFINVLNTERAKRARKQNVAPYKLTDRFALNTNRYFFDKPLFVKSRTSFESSKGFAVYILIKYLSSGSLKTYFIGLSYL